MTTCVFIADKVHAEGEAMVSVFDRGFLYGDSVYEVTRTSGGHPVDLGLHLQRLSRSARAILLPSVADDKIYDAIEQTLLAAQNEESYIRIMITRGAGDIGLDPALADQPRLVVIVRELSVPSAQQLADGVAVAMVDVHWNLRRAVDPAVKSGNYLSNVMALAEARKKGAYEAVMCNANGHVAEGSSSNIFCVREGVLLTPPAAEGLLDGITRRRVCELAREAGMTVIETAMRSEEFVTSDEAFLTSSIRGVVPIVTVDQNALGTGAPGPLTRQVMSLYQQFLARAASGDV